jgi:orotate phosphoribosyltransferase
MLTQDEVLNIFKETGALLNGHFKLTSGMHGAVYFEKFQVLQYPNYVELLCKEIADRFADDNIQLVVGPTTGGILLAYEIGKQLGVRGIFAERAEQGRIFKRGFVINPGERVLVVDDVLTTGGSAWDTINAVKYAGGVLAGVGLLVDRTGGAINFGVKTEALISLSVEKYKPSECPLCKEGVHLTET